MKKINKDQKINSTQPEEYLTTFELSERIKMTPGTIRNLIWKKKFQKDVHYIKPSSRKLLFVWRKVEAWLCDHSHEAEFERASRVRSLIDI